jgi:hypothetical protein
MDMLCLTLSYQIGGVRPGVSRRPARYDEAATGIHRWLWMYGIHQGKTTAVLEFHSEDLHYLQPRGLRTQEDVGRSPHLSKPVTKMNA